MLEKEIQDTNVHMIAKNTLIKRFDKSFQEDSALMGTAGTSKGDSLANRRRRKIATQDGIHQFQAVRINRERKSDLKPLNFDQKVVVGLGLSLIFILILLGRNYNYSRCCFYDAFHLESKIQIKQEFVIPVWYKNFQGQASSLRAEFASRYGGENKARLALSKGLITFDRKHSDSDQALLIEDEFQINLPSHLRDGAILLANMQNNQSESIQMSFGGYSVTAGHGNYFHQSYPFVLKDLLSEIFHTVFNHTLIIKNAAIGGVPSIPYGMCLKNFYGRSPLTASWDFSMNEPGGATKGLEAYIRHAAIAFDNSPIFIVKDTHMAKARRDLIQYYVDAGLLLDPLVILTDPALSVFVKPNVLGDYVVQDQDPTLLPHGLLNWRKFGAPEGSPGQTRHHPAVQEHILIAWLLAMHFLSLLQIVAAERLLLEQPHRSQKLQRRNLYRNIASSSIPVPLGIPNKIESNFFFGQPSGPQVWKMSTKECRTTFDPIENGNLEEIVISGIVQSPPHMTQEDWLMINDKHSAFNQGWLLEYGSTEKKARQKLKTVDPEHMLGFIESKKAYYGVLESGNLTLAIPRQSIKEPTALASNHISSIVFCEVNEKRGHDECSLSEDLTIIIGGIETSNPHHLITSTGPQYLGKHICIYVKVPLDSQISEEVLIVDISVNNPNLKVEGACSISHVIWELVS